MNKKKEKLIRMLAQVSPEKAQLAYLAEIAKSNNRMHERIGDLEKAVSAQKLEIPSEFKISNLDQLKQPEQITVKNQPVFPEQVSISNWPAQKELPEVLKVQVQKDENQTDQVPIWLPDFMVSAFEAVAEILSTIMAKGIEVLQAITWKTSIEQTVRTVLINPKTGNPVDPAIFGGGMQHVVGGGSISERNLQYLRASTPVPGYQRIVDETNAPSMTVVTHKLNGKTVVVETIEVDGKITTITNS